MICPSGCRPRVPTLAETPIAGMVSVTGTECLSDLIGVVELAGRLVVVVAFIVVVVNATLPGSVPDRAPITDAVAMTTSTTPSNHHLRSTRNLRSRTTRVAVSSSSRSAQSATASTERRRPSGDRNGERTKTDQTRGRGVRARGSTKSGGRCSDGDDRH